MRTITRLAAIAAVTATASVLLAAPAQADDLPAVTGCPFSGLYTTNTDGQLSGLKSYYRLNTALTVTGGDATAWQVTVDRDGQRGWMEGACVFFFA